MKTTTAVCLLSLSVFAAERRPVLAVFPPAAVDPGGKELALLIQARTSAVLATTERYSDIHLKQILAMASREGLDIEGLEPKNSDRAARLLGAERLAWGQLERNEKGFRLKAVVSDLKKITRVEVQLGSDLAVAVEAAAATISHAMLRVEGVTGFKTPPPVSTKSDAAMQAFSHCYATVVRQPMGIENPAVLDAAELEVAITQCKEALTADPKFAPASAALGLAYAIMGNDVEALKALTPLKGADLDQPLYWIARFWEVTRYQSNDAGEALLREAISKRPGFLLARAYLGELLDTLGKHDKAAVAWQEFAAVAPADPYVLGRHAKSLARLGKHDEALELTKKALELEPRSREMRLQLASRFIDAAKVDEALPVLTALSDEPETRGEVLLRLGWAYYLKGSMDLAAPLFEKAIVRAKSPGEWRTRGRAHYDLALIHAKNAPAKAEAALKASLLTGFKMKDVDPSLQKIAQKIEKAELSKPAKKPAAPVVLPREVSLFPIDTFGEVDSAATKPAAPEGFMVVHF